MKKAFIEMVVDCPFILLKGFLRGLITCRDVEVIYFFPKRDGIELETFKESLKEWLGIESHVHLLIEEDFGDYLERALNKNYDRLKVSVISKKKVKEAFFDFSFVFFDEKVLKSVKEDIEKELKGCEDCRGELSIKEGYEPVVDDVGGGVSPLITGKRYYLEGYVRGYLPDVVDFRNQLHDFALKDISKIKLMLEE